MSSKNGKEIGEELLKRQEILENSKFFNIGGTDKFYKSQDSKAEYDFYHEFVKWSHVGVVAQLQVLMFRLDYFLYWKEHGVGVEIDGAKWHDSERDSRRDRIILDESGVDAIVRFNASDSIFNPSFCVYFLNMKYPWMFKEGSDPVRLSRKMEFHGIYKIDNPVEGELHGYKTYDYAVHFMIPEKHIEYMSDTEEYSYSEDYNPDLEPDYMDYCYQKVIQVKVMSQ